MNTTIKSFVSSEIGEIAMKQIERIICKVIIIQLCFLLLAQILLHKFSIFPEWKEITKYEGVTSDNNFSQVLETFNGK